MLFVLSKNSIFAVLDQWLIYDIKTGGGLVQLVATLVRSTSYSTPGPVSTGMGDRIGVQLPVREIYLSLTNHPGQLILAIPLWVGAMSTGQRAVMLCNWE